MLYTVIFHSYSYNIQNIVYNINNTPSLELFGKRGEPMLDSITNLIDIGKLESLLKNCQSALGLYIGISDKNGNEQINLGCSDICSKYHLINPHMHKACIRYRQQYTKYLHEHSQDNKSIVCPECPNGMYNAVSPVVFEGEHIANLVVGQFFLAQPNEAWFRDQAEVNDLEEEGYLKALAKVPVISYDYISSTVHLSGNCLNC